MMAGTSNPYVGPRAFDRNEQEYFFGRDEEITILEGLVMARRASLFFAQSGAGKSSLLRAGLIPRLTEQIRVGHGRRVRTYQKMRVLPITSVGGLPGADSADHGSIFVHNALSRLRPDLDSASLSENDLTTGLAPLMAASTQADGPASTLLIFDQFEELFTHGGQSLGATQEEFFRQVSQALDNYPDLRVLFSMREDYIAELTPYTALLPEQLRPRFRMERLRSHAALTAVKEPAALAGRPFDDGVAEALVNNLRRTQLGRAEHGRLSNSRSASANLAPKERASGQTTQDRNGEIAALGDFVEPVHLQIVCRQLWDALPSDQSKILSTDVQEFGDVDEALTGFYERSLVSALAAAPTSERSLRNWFSEKLITPAHTRGLVYSDEASTAGLDNAIVDVLRDAYIVRADLRSGETWYELAHDRLIEPILASNRRWREDYYNPLAVALSDWQQAGRDPAKLLRGSQLESAKSFAASHPEELTADEQALLDASIRQAQLEAGLARQAARRRKIIIGATTGTILVLVALTTWALRNAATAQAERAAAQTAQREAEQQQQISSSRELAAASIASLAIDPERGILLALQAHEITHTLEAENALHLALQTSRVAQLLTGHVATVNKVAYSPDGSRLATAGWDGTVRIWDTATGEQIATLGDQVAQIHDVVFTPHGEQIITADESGTVVIWDSSGVRQRTIDAHRDTIREIAVSPDGARLATAGGDLTAAVWDIRSGELLFPLNGHSNDIWSIAYSPDGLLIATGSQDRSVRIWATETGEELFSLNVHDDTVSGVAFSPDSQYLATSSHDNSAKIVELASGDVVRTLFGHLNWVRGVTFSPDGTKVATTGWDRTARVWDVATGRELFTLAGHRDWVKGVEFSPDGRLLATASADGTARVWNVAGSREVHTVEAHGGPVTSIDVSGDGLYMVTGGGDGLTIIWDIQSGNEVARIPAHQGAVTDVAFSPDGSRLATAGADRTAKVWDAESGELLFSVQGHNVPVLGVSFSPDARLLASSGADETIRLTDMVTGSELAAIPAHSSRVNNAMFNVNGDQLVSSSGDGTVKVWDTETNDLRLTLPHDAQVYRAAFNPDGSRIATAGVDETARIWDASTGDELLVLRDHIDRVQSIAYSPDGTFLATASWDGTSKVWNAQNGDLLLTLHGHTDRVLDVAFSRDGGRLITASADGTVRIYFIRLPELVELAELRVTRGLTDEECRRFLRQERCGSPSEKQ